MRRVADNERLTKRCVVNMTEEQHQTLLGEAKARQLAPGVVARMAFTVGLTDIDVSKPSKTGDKKNGATTGRSLEVYLVDGRPDGILVAESFNWAIHVLKAPRTLLKAALAREEANRTGVYVLLGEREGKPLAYIGMSKNIGERIRNHNQEDWWETAILVTSLADRLNETHARFLEARLIEKARSVDRHTLDNDRIPTPQNLGEVGEAQMQEFLDQLLLILPALQTDLFVDDRRLETQQENSPVFELVAPDLGIKATAFQEENGKFVVKQGSQARVEWVGNNPTCSSARLHAELVGRKVLLREGEHRIFTNNLAFDSPSAAASVVRGTPANGHTEWKVQGKGQLYREWQLLN